MMVMQPNRSKEEADRDMIDARLEKARRDLLAALAALRAGTLSTKEADAVRGQW